MTKLRKLKKKRNIKICNRIEARLIKCADLLTDLKSLQKYKKYFVTEKEDKNNWYKQEDAVRTFYVYQELSEGQEIPIYGICQYVHFRRKGYDDGVTIFGVYPVDEDGNISGLLRGVKVVEGTLQEGVDEITDKGIKGWGRLFLTGLQPTTNFNELKEYVNSFIQERNENIK